MIFRKADILDASFMAKWKDCGFSDCWTEKMLNESFSFGTLNGLIAAEGDEDIGYITYCAAGDTADVQIVFVVPKFRRRGVGQKLLLGAEKELKDSAVKKIFLEVRESNAAAIGLYGKIGFKQISVRKKYYADGEDALVMLKEI